MEEFIESPRFPEKISYGSNGGPNFNTNVITVASGGEKRNINWSEPLYRYEVSHGVKTLQQIEELTNFFYTVMGKGIGFRYKDWKDCKVTIERSSINDGNDLAASGEFQLCKKYSIGVNSARYRVIKKPVVGTVKIFLNGVETENFTCDYTKGIITLTGDFEPEAIVTWSGEFDVPVRFDTDTMNTTIESFASYSWNQIPVVELR